MISRTVDAEESIRGTPLARHTEIELRHAAVDLNQGDRDRDALVTSACVVTSAFDSQVAAPSQHATTKKKRETMSKGEGTIKLEGEPVERQEREDKKNKYE